ncbi:MAG: RNA polymerase factor sigma-54 [Burkholderiaceae bacterium]
MKQGLSLRVSQHLALTPQLQQSIRLLQLSTLELSQEIEQMLGDNPFLEMAVDEAPREEFGLPQADTRPQGEDHEGDYESPSSSSSSSSDGGEAEAPLEKALDDGWEGDGASGSLAADDTEWGGDAPSRKSGDNDGEMEATELARQQETLQEHLHRQALSLRLSAEDRAALRFLIESLNDDGYLEDSLQSLAEGLAGSDMETVDERVHRVTVALGLLQHLDPAGVGARHLGECLSLQLKATPASELDVFVREAALRICAHPMELLARRDVKRLAQLCGETEARVKLAIAAIARLEPKPGRRFVDVERNIVTPDVIVAKAARGAGKFTVRLNSDVMPRLKVHDIYASALRQHKGEGSQALQQRLQEARWFIKNIQQRFDTILRVSNAIVERQKSFFVHGELAMRPLVLREIADELGLHESTISRVTTAKYMSTPWGTFELKYFFGSALSTETGGNASSTAVRALIKQFVTAESTKKPLSDNQISEMLKEQGIECARRTVAKYREALRIAPANLRKAL